MAGVTLDLQLPSLLQSAPTLGWYQIILLGDRGIAIGVNNLHKILTK